MNCPHCGSSNFDTTLSLRWTPYELLDLIFVGIDLLIRWCLRRTVEPEKPVWECHDCGYRTRNPEC